MSKFEHPFLEPFRSRGPNVKCLSCKRDDVSTIGGYCDACRSGIVQALKAIRIGKEN